MSKHKKTREPKEENVTLGPTVRDREHVFGVAYIFASFNDTFIDMKDLDDFIRWVELHAKEFTDSKVGGESSKQKGRKAAF